MLRLVLSVASLASVAASSPCVAPCIPPEQIHVSLTGKPGEMVVDWVSSADSSTSVAQVSPMPYGGASFTEAKCNALNRTGGPGNATTGHGKGFGCCGCAPNSATARGWDGCVWSNSSTPKACHSMIKSFPASPMGTSKDMQPTGPARNYSLHSAVMRGLTCGQQYFYALGDTKTGVFTDEPPQISFHMLCEKGFGGREPVWAAYGDLGLDVDQYRDIAPSIPMLASDLQNGEKGPKFDGVIHAGDYAYDFSNDNGRVGDRFMNALQGTASKVPYMGAVGNHECGGSNLQHYARRYGGLINAATNSGAKSAGSTEHGDALWLSWNTGLVHFIAVNSEVWNSPKMQPIPGTGSCVWNPKTNRSLMAEFGEWLEDDLKKVNADGQREKTPWVVSFAHKAWYMQPGCNFSFIDDLAHKYGIDLHVGGHIHTYQRFFPLRMNPLGPIYEKNGTTIPNNKPADVDFDCASTGEQGHGVPGLIIENNTYTDPKYLVTIVAGSPGNHEVTPVTTNESIKSGRCIGSVKNPSFNEPLAACRDNYGYGYLQGTNATHLHWTWKYAGFGTPHCETPPCPTPDPSSWPESVFHDELWIVKNKGSHGPRDYEAPNRMPDHSKDFEEYKPTGTETNFKYWYEASRDEWQIDGCGELPADDDVSDGCEPVSTVCDIRNGQRTCTGAPKW